MKAPRYGRSVFRNLALKDVDKMLAYISAGGWGAI